MSCSLHRTREGAWDCTSCQRSLCPLCAAPDPERAGEALCAHCGAAARPRLVAKQAPSNLAMVPAFLGSLLSLRGLSTVLLLSVVLTVVPYFICFGGFLAGGFFASYFFLVLQHAMHGSHQLPVPRFNSLADDAIVPAVRFLVPTSMLVVPIALYVRRQLRLGAFTGVDEFAHDPVLVAMILGALLVYPALLIVAAVNQSQIFAGVDESLLAAEEPRSPAAPADLGAITASFFADSSEPSPSARPSPPVPSARPSPPVPSARPSPPVPSAWPSPPAPLHPSPASRSARSAPWEDAPAAVPAPAGAAVQPARRDQAIVGALDVPPFPLAARPAPEDAEFAASAARRLPLETSQQVLPESIARGVQETQPASDSAPDRPAPTPPAPAPARPAARRSGPAAPPRRAPDGSLLGTDGWIKFSTPPRRPRAVVRGQGCA